MEALDPTETKESNKVGFIKMQYCTKAAMRVKIRDKKRHICRGGMLILFFYSKLFDEVGIFKFIQSDLNLKASSIHLVAAS